MNKEDKIHINSFKFYDRDELEDLTKKYYLENKKLKYELEQCIAVADTNRELAESYYKENQQLKEQLKIIKKTTTELLNYLDKNKLVLNNPNILDFYINVKKILDNKGE